MKKIKPINTGEKKRLYDKEYLLSRKERDERAKERGIKIDAEIINRLICSHTLDELYEGVDANSSVYLCSSVADLNRAYAPDFEVSHFASIGILTVYYLKGKSSEQFHRDRGPRINGCPAEDWKERFGEKPGLLQRIFG